MLKRLPKAVSEANVAAYGDASYILDSYKAKQASAALLAKQAKQIRAVFEAMTNDDLDGAYVQASAEHQHIILEVVTARGVI